MLRQLDLEATLAKLMITSKYAITTLAAIVAVNAGILVAGGEGKAIKGREGLVAVPLLDNGDLPRPLMGVGVDEKGKVYVTETIRQAREEVSLLQSNFLHEADMALTTVENKEDWIRNNYSERIAKAQRLEDQNGDGVVDLADLVLRSERIYTLEDVDGDGLFDGAKLFADGFNEITTGVAHSVTPIGDSVYATIIPDLWRLKDEDGDGRAEVRERLVHGFANHIGYGNHDLHCVVRGFDGKIYWSMGARGLNVVSQEGERWAYPHTGSVVRCNLDGSEFEVVASGLRNCQEFDFDDYGNLFAIDHDADFQGEMERLVFLPEGSDSGWRNYYQYRTTNRVLKDFAKDFYSPWLAEKMWVPLHEGQPSHFLSPIENSWNAPAAFSFQPGTALGGNYRGHFLLGGMGMIRAFKMVPDGASFRRQGEDAVVSEMGSQVLSSVFGPDGRLYFTLWPPSKVRSSLWALGAPDEANEEGAEVARLLASGLKDKSVRELRRLLGFTDRRVRLEAQFELAMRKDIPALKSAVLDEKEPQLARIHGLWGLTQLKYWDRDVFKAMESQDDAELVAQAARWIGEVGRETNSVDECREAVVELLGHASPRVKLMAAISCGKLKAEAGLGALERMIEEANNESPVLREAGVLGLMGAASIEHLEGLAAHHSEPVRIAAVVALGRLGETNALLTFVDDPSVQVMSDAVRGIYDVADVDTFEANPLALTTVAENLGSDSPRSVNVRAMAAFRRLGTREAAERILGFLTNPQTTGQMERLIAMDMLASWSVESTLDPVDGRYFPISAFAAEDMAAAFLPYVEKLIYDENAEVAERAIRLLADVPEANGFNERAAEHVLDESMPVKLRLAWLRLLQTQSLELLDGVAVEALSSPVSRVSAAAANYLMEREDGLGKVQEYLLRTLQGNTGARELQNALGLLVWVPERSTVLRSLMKDLLAGEVMPAIHLEVVEAAGLAAEEDEKLDALLASYNKKVQGQEPFGAFGVALEGGDPINGKSLFLGHTAASCSKCHALKQTDKQIGPSLEGIAERLTRTELLESMLDPQAKVTLGYGIQTLALEDGRSVVGTQLDETAQQITLKNTDSKVETFDKSEIRSMTAPIGAMPTMKGIVSKRDLRDLVAYLATLKSD